MYVCMYVYIIWAPQSGRNAEGASRRVRAPHLRAVVGSNLGVWESVVSSPSGVRDGAPAASDFFVYKLYRLQQVSISIRTVKYRSLSISGQIRDTKPKAGQMGAPGEL